MRLALDTNAYSEFMRGSPVLKDWIQLAEEIGVSTVVMGELRSGFEAGKKAKANEAGLVRFLQSSRVVVHGIDEQTTFHYARILCALREVGRPIPTNDIWIAASAVQHGYLLVTRDAHFDGLPGLAKLSGF